MSELTQLPFKIADIGEANFGRYANVTGASDPWAAPRSWAACT